jgi:Tle cognate immunity protein 4 C-terminal domain
MRNVTNRDVRRFVVWTAMAGALFGSCASISRESGSTPVPVMNDRNVQGYFCVGRFLFRTPPEFHETARLQSMYRTKMSTQAGNAAQGREYWSKRLASLFDSAKSTAQSQAFQTLDLAQDIHAVWYSGNSTFPNIRTIEAMKQFRDHIFILSREAENGKEEVAQRFARDIFAGYEPESDKGFCIGRGSIILEPSRNEETRLAMSSDVAPTLELVFATRTASAPDLSTYSDTDEESQVARAHNGNLTVLRNDQRTVAGLIGKELRIRVVVPGESPLTRYTWHFPGQPGRTNRPVIDLVGTVSGERAVDLDRAWEVVLGSLRANEASQQPGG